MTDHNCFIGNWPFYRIDSSFEALCREHGENGIGSGYISALESVFYNDFYESEQALDKIIRGSGYRHTVIPNPTVQGFDLTLDRCLDEFEVQGIRLVPSYQGYSLDLPALDNIIDVARRLSLPIFINARLTDERMTHIMCPVLPSAEEIADFIDRADGVRVVLCYLKEHEADAVWKNCKNRENLYFDTSGMAGCLLGDNLPDYICRCVLGTGFPLRTVRSSVMRITSEILDESLKDAMLNAKI